MAKLKWDDFDDEALDGVDWDPETDGGFTPYDGPIPPNNTILKGDVKKAWSTTSKAGNPMIKLLWEASGNEGDKKIYNGLPVWHNVVFMKEYPGLWKPFLAAFGLTASDVKNKTVVDTNDESNHGKSIVKISNSFKPGAAKVAIVTKREKYNDEDQVRISKFLLAVDENDDSDDEDTPF